MNTEKYFIKTNVQLMLGLRSGCFAEEGISKSDGGFWPKCLPPPQFTIHHPDE